MKAGESSGASVLLHREPFLFVNRIASHGAQSSVGVATFGRERDSFRGHFPACPVVPGVIVARKGDGR